MLPARASSTAFAAAFFFLPLSKPLTMIAVLAGTALLAFDTGLRAPRASVPGWAWAALVLAALPQLSVAVHPEGPGNLEFTSVGYYWLFAAMVWLGARRSDVREWLVAFVAGTVLLWLALQVEALLGRPLPGPRLAGMGNYILASQFLALALLVAALLNRTEARARRRIAWWAVVAAMLVGLATGAGRTGQVVAVVLMPVIAASLAPGRGPALAAIGTAVGIAALVLSPTVQTRIDAAVQDVVRWRDAEGAQRWVTPEGKQNSLGYRLEMWRTSAEVFAEHPLTGGGPRAFQRAWWARFPSPAERFSEPHSAYAFYAAAYGLPGIVALVAFLALLARSGWRHRHRLVGGVVLGFAVITALAGVTNTLVLGTTSMLTLMLFTGLSGALAGAGPEPGRG
jgi:O-antigen ligase